MLWAALFDDLPSSHATKKNPVVFEGVKLGMNLDFEWSDFSISQMLHLSTEHTSSQKCKLLACRLARGCSIFDKHLMELLIVMLGVLGSVALCLSHVTLACV